MLRINYARGSVLSILSMGACQYLPYTNIGNSLQTPEVLILQFA